MRRRLRDWAYTAGMAAGGILLYIPAALGLALTEFKRTRVRAEPIYEFDGIGDLKWAPVRKSKQKHDLWAELNLAQYFTIVPGIAAVPGGCKAFSRPCLH
jgi:hypothetical protein